MNITLRPMEEAEKMYCYTQSQQIMAQTGCIGYLRADMDTDGIGFYSEWDDHCRHLKTDEFRTELDAVINALRFDEESGRILWNRSQLSKFCFSHDDAAIGNDGREFGFRSDTDKYSYLFRLNPNKGEYNVYCYCYRKDYLDEHMKEAARGIRFVDLHYNELFRVPDGGKIRIRFPDGKTEEKSCRYIDPYHVEIGAFNTLYHICQFAEMLAECGAKAEPLTEIPKAEKKKRPPVKAAER